MISRVKYHFSSSGQLGKRGFSETSTNYFSMKGSTKLEREVYEQYRILNQGGGIENLLNVRNPMGGRMDIYNELIDGVLSTYKLPK